MVSRSQPEATSFIDKLFETQITAQGSPNIEKVLQDQLQTVRDSKPS
jgi:hypothetical protein